MRFASFLLLTVATPALAAPTVAVTGPASSTTQKTTFTVTGKTTDAPNPGGITITVSQVVNGIEKAVGGYTATVNAKTGTWSVDLTLPVGTDYKVYAFLDNTSPVAFDEIYDITVAAPVPVAGGCEVCAGPPILTGITYPLAGSTYPNNSVMPVTAQVTLNVGRTTWVYMEIEGVNAGNTYYFGDVAQVWSGTQNVAFTSTEPMPAGTYRVTLSNTVGGTEHSLEFTVSP